MIIVKRPITIRAKPRQAQKVESNPNSLPKITKRQARKRMMRRRAQATSLK
jgi:hypothetical protein